MNRHEVPVHFYACLQVWKKNCKNVLEITTSGTSHKCIKLTKSGGPTQIAPEGAVWPGPSENIAEIKHLITQTFCDNQWVNANFEPLLYRKQQEITPVEIGGCCIIRLIIRFATIGWVFSRFSTKWSLFKWEAYYSQDAIFQVTYMGKK